MEKEGAKEEEGTVERAPGAQARNEMGRCVKFHGAFISTGLAGGRGAGCFAGQPAHRPAAAREGGLSRRSAC